MFGPTDAAPAVDQLLAAIEHTEARRGPHAEKTDVLPDFFVDLDPRLEAIVRTAADSPLKHRWRNGRLIEVEANDVGGYARWAARPTEGVLLGPGWQDHVIAARQAALGRLVRRCDRCGETVGGLLLTLALTPPHLVVIALDGQCVDELEVQSFTFGPR